MGEEADRFARVAGTFDARVNGVTDWDAPAPCDGWVARDVVRHLVEWVPGLFAGVGLAAPDVSVDDDPARAWRSLYEGLQAVLGDPASSERTMQVGPAGEHTVAVAVDRFVTPDVLVHTWDLARATGQDDTIDAELSASTLAGFEAMGDVLVKSGHFAPAVAVAEGARAQDRLIAASGRDPAWRP